MTGTDITQDLVPLLPAHLRAPAGEMGSRVDVPVQFLKVARVGARGKAQAYIHDGRLIVGIVGGVRVLAGSLVAVRGPAGPSALDPQGRAGR